MPIMTVKNFFFDRFTWLVILSFLFFQSILHAYSILSNVALLCIAICQITCLDVKKRNLLFAISLWLIILFVYSLFMGNELSLAIRFSMIVFFILFSYLWKIDYHFYLRILFICSFLLVISLMALELYMFTLSNSEYLALRNGLFIANDMGDVFWYEVYYKLELRGTPLLVFVYMLSYSSDVFPRRHLLFFRLFYIVGVIFAGNFAYQMALVIFHVVFYICSSIDKPSMLVRKIIWMFFLSLIIGGILYSYIESEMKAKSDISNAIRYDQARVLFEDMSDNPISFLLGSGLGHTVEQRTRFRDYRGDTYFELQTLYIFNQLGLFNFTLFVFVNIIFAISFIRIPKLLLVYGVYVVYAFFNPYIWDTNQIVVITSLLCAKNQIMNNLLNEKRNNNMHLSTLEPVS